MKLRKLELTNVRRFNGQKAKLGPFGDGLTTVTAENEAGKSTFFDALHALLFISHSSSAQEVKNLQPYSGGAVSVAAEIEIDGKEFRIEKTFNAQKSAKVIDCATGQIIKQQGDAEAWIEENVNKAHKGPAGLLWVRQGATHVDPQGKDKDANNISARRDLMSSVRGQIDAVTGGRRMDKIVERCSKELEAMATKTLKAKAGSPWKLAEDKVEELLSRKERLQKDVGILSQALETKRRAKARLRDLQNHDKQAERAQQITLAAEALRKAEQHDRSIQEADKALQIVVAQKDHTIRQIKDLTDARDRRQQLADDISRKEANIGKIKAAQHKADNALNADQGIITQKETERRDLGTSLTAARQKERSRAKWDRLRELAELSGQLSVPQRKLNAAETVLKSPEVTQKDLDRFADLGRRISVAKEQRRVQFARFSVRPSGAAMAKIEGKTIHLGEDVLVDRPIDLFVPGFGDVCLRPAEGSGKGIEDPAALQAEYDGALRELSFETLQLARNAFNARQRALNDENVAIAEIRGLAPDGVDALNEEWQSLCAELGHSPDEQPPTQVALEASEFSTEQIEESIGSLDEELEELRAEVKKLQLDATKVASEVAEASGVLNHLSQELTSLEKPRDEDAQLEALERTRANKIQKEDEARQALDLLTQSAPDLEVARSSHERLLGAEKGDREEINTLERELARVNGAIETQSEGAVEEKLAEVEEQLVKASERADRYELQAKALAMLIEHLDAARKDAQETYFEPIRSELRPLLAQLHAGADFELDPEKMLVGKIIRNGVEDDVNVLSGGAYEQIAILTRLAFAKLFAKQGRHVPLILDDALVHTDDERISAMFNVLSQVAQDQQIIVLSCRTRAFSDLGGTRAFIETEAI